MGGRYSDRFFGPEAAGDARSNVDAVGDPTSDEVPAEAAVEDRRRPRRAYRPVALAATAGLVIGAIAGGVAWVQRQDSQADAVARSTVTVRSPQPVLPSP